MLVARTSLVSLAVLTLSVVACGGNVVIPAEEPDVGNEDASDVAPSETSGSDTLPDASPDAPTPADAPDVLPDVVTDAGCTAPRKVCGAVCVDVTSDDANCGDCGTACTSGLKCDGGTCKCPGLMMMCGPLCVNPATDTANCGGCGIACVAGASCLGGICVCPTVTPDACGSACTDVKTDASNCGFCGSKCATGATCTGGVCACATGEMVCGGKCIGVLTDTFNCGTCGKVCPTGGSCTAGSCSCPVAKPDTCAGACVDKTSDPLNCGSCGFSCGSGTCVSGACTCATGMTKCSGACVDTKVDALNCGACGTPCTGLCVGGVCTTPKCKTTAPNVLFYGPTGSVEKAYLPTGATTTVATAATWATMTTADFAKYDIIVFGEPDGSGPTVATLDAAYKSRAVWGAAVNGRVVVTGLDPSFHAPTHAGAATFLKATFSWLATGPVGATALYVSSDWGRTSLNFLSALASSSTFTSVAYTSDTIVATKTHPILTGSTSASLSSWGSSAHSNIPTYPATFSVVATTGGQPVILPRDVGCAP